MISESSTAGYPRAMGPAGSAILLMYAAGIASAQSPVPEAPPLEEVVVTAQKEAQPLQRVPISVKAITAATLESINAESAEDYLRLVPSVAMTNLARGGNQIQIRGLGSNVGNVGTVAVYNDGVISPSRIQASGTFSEQDPALFDVERVEVLRGPQGTLYGEGSFGGVINIISKRPALDKFQAGFSGTWFDTAHGSDSNGDLAGMFNAPLVKDVFGIRAIGYSYKHDGWIDQVGPVIDTLFAGLPMRLLKEDANTEHVTGGRAVASFKPSENFDATLIFKTERINSGAYPIVSSGQIAIANAIGGTNFDPDYSQAADLAGISQRTKTTQGILEFNVNTHIGRLTSIGGYGETQGSNSLGRGDENSAWNEELRLASDNSGLFSWIVGAYYRSAKSDVTLTQLGIPLAATKVDGSAAFGQGYWHFAPQWTATLGLRFERQTSDVLDKPNQLRSHATFTSTVPKLAIDYQHSENALYYASIAKGFRAGGANIDESLGTDPRFRAPFDPDTIWNYEIGAKLSVLDRALTVNTALFYIDWQNIQIDQPINSLIALPNGFIVLNGKTAHSYGIETDVYYNPTPQWTISTGGSWLNAEYDDGVINSLAGSFALKGQELPSTPKYTANASVERRLHFGTALEGYVRGDYTLRGSSFGDVPNDPGVGFFGIVGKLASGASKVTNLRAGVRRDTWDFQVFCTNVFDTHASTFTLFDGGFTDLRAILPPRMLGVSVRVRYN